MTIRCVTFDLDDTLWDSEELLVDAEQAFFRWLDQNYPEVTSVLGYEQLIAHRRATLNDIPHKAHDLTYVRRRWLGLIAERFGLPREVFVDKGFQVFWKMRNAVTLYDDVHHTLQELKRSFQLGAITNGNADVHYIGIGHYFDVCMTPAEAGCAKPASRIFHTVLEAFSARPEEVVHVGDDPVTDVVGAKRAGMRAIWVNPKGAPWSGELEPDGEIKSLSEVEATIAAL